MKAEMDYLCVSMLRMVYDGSKYIRIDTSKFLKDMNSSEDDY